MTIYEAISVALQSNLLLIGLITVILTIVAKRKK
ncbi:putative holin-like toxin [Heyndrickxia sporothermodurans]|nr:putative holin-like toxin [Heyndrickxia sporothermodurans]